MRRQGIDLAVKSAAIVISSRQTKKGACKLFGENALSRIEPSDKTWRNLISGLIVERTSNTDSSGSRRRATVHGKRLPHRMVREPPGPPESSTDTLSRAWRPKGQMAHGGERKMRRRKRNRNPRRGAQDREPRLVGQDTHARRMNVAASTIALGTAIFRAIWELIHRH